MNRPPPVVVKVGGSLFDHTQLFPGLRTWLKALGKRVILVPGGGEAAEAVRTWDRIHQLGEEASHKIALTSLQASLQLFASQFPESPIIPQMIGRPMHPVSLLNLWEFAQREDIPHGWHVTTDSLAAYAAGTIGCKLILLKSRDLEDAPNWEQAARRGIVDAHFPMVVLHYQLEVEVINFRLHLDSLIDNEVTL
jgi:5-(aminomethyl)-3-furanmethanol phosphate kinase